MKLRTLFLFAICLACPTVSLAQDTFFGTDIAITMKPAQLTAEDVPLKLKEQSSGAFGDYYSGFYFQVSSLGLRSEPGSRIQELLELLQISWTRNRVVKLYNQDFLVTYILEPSIDDLRAFSEGKGLKDPSLKLRLMKTDQIGTIEPFPEMNVEKYRAILDSFSGKGKPAEPTMARTMALSNMKQCLTSLHMYMADHDDLLPYVQSSPALLEVAQPYSKSEEVWKTLNPSKANGQFRFNMSLAGALVSDVPEPANTPMLYDPIPWPNGMVLVGFVDGHTKFVSTDAWNAMQPLLKMKLKRHGKPIGAPGEIQGILSRTRGG